MNYDESVFKEKANRRARKIWLIFAILLSANYGSDVVLSLNALYAAEVKLKFLFDIIEDNRLVRIHFFIRTVDYLNFVSFTAETLHCICTDDKIADISSISLKLLL